MNQPAYKQKLNIYCAAKGCSKIVKSNGVPIFEHFDLHHKFSKGETAAVCKYCRAKSKKMEPLAGDGGNWTLGDQIIVEKENETI